PAWAPRTTPPPPAPANPARPSIRPAPSRPARARPQRPRQALGARPPGRRLPRDAAPVPTEGDAPLPTPAPALRTRAPHATPGFSWRPEDPPTRSSHLAGLANSCFVGSVCGAVQTRLNVLIPASSTTAFTNAEPCWYWRIFRSMPRIRRITCSPRLPVDRRELNLDLICST